MEELTYLQWGILSLSAMLIGMSKTGVQGVTLLAVPFLALSFGAKESTGLILPMLCMADIMAVAYYRRSADWRIVLRLLPTAILGFFIAIGVDSMIPKESFRQLMGYTLALVLLVMLITEVTGKENRFTGTWWYACIFGLLGGFTTMIGNAAGPVMSVYLLSMRKQKQEYIGINAWFFLVINLLKVPLQLFAWHNITENSILLDLAMLPVIAIGAAAGIWMVGLFRESGFRRFIITVTVISVLMMILG